jgi:hypothetical protein
MYGKIGNLVTNIRHKNTEGESTKAENTEGETRIVKGVK